MKKRFAQINFRKKSPVVVTFIISLALLIISVPCALSATIHGKVFDYSLSLTSGSIVMINTIPEQRVVAVNGEYSFNVPKGDYLIVAFANDDTNQIVYFVQENISIMDNGDYTRDLIMFPYSDLGELEFDNVFVNEISAIDFNLTAKPKTSASSLSSMLLRLMIVLAGIVILGAVFILFMSNKKKKNAKDGEQNKKVNLEEYNQSSNNQVFGQELVDDESKKVLEFIRQQKRTTQKEVRKTFPLSEAKVSLIISDLESQGLIRKIKKGRGNILIAQ